MAKSLKDAGTRELEALEKRVRRQQALDRIEAADTKELLRRISALKAYIREMDEQP